MSIDINQLPPRMDWGLAVARGEVQRAQGINRWGFNPLVRTTYETVWELGGIYEYPSTAVAMTLASDEGAADESVEITVTGLDSDWKLLSETVTLDASGEAVTTELFLRINEVRVSNGLELTGNVTVSNGGTNYGYIDAQFGKSISSVYSVPVGYDAYILNGKVTVSKQRELLAKLMVRPFGKIFTAEGIVGSSGSPYSKEWTIPIYLAPKTDIEVRALANSATEMTTAFEILLVEQS
jgi:hypothetical protein